MRNDALIQARKRCGWTQDDVAAFVGVDKKTYDRWEKGQQTPSLRHMRRLCEVFGTSAERLGLHP